MRKLTEKSRVLVRQTSIVVDGRPLVIEVHHDHIVIREKKRRKKTAVAISYRDAWDTGRGLGWLTGDPDPKPQRMRAYTDDPRVKIILDELKSILDDEKGEPK